MARTNHRDFHKKLTEMGYDIYFVDYAQGGHYYQFNKQDGSDWNEYGVNTKKKIIDATVNSEVFPLLKEYYENQGYKIISIGKK